ncbi:MAG: response regulator [Acidobacteria bacterium]|nr:response regulator [Acidobacteriota bacterium]
MAGRLLLVGELNEDLIELKIAFEAVGLTVVTAPDGVASLEKGAELQPDLVVTEILINRLSGFELASRIRGGAAGFAAPVIFYTEFYRDEKARREVLTKYGAIQYLVRPFQKEALKTLVVAHFQDFLSGRPGTPVVAGTPEPSSGSAPEVSSVVPQLSRAAAAAEKPTTNLVSGRPMQPGKPGGFSGEVPARFRAFSPTAQTPASEVADPEPEVAGTVTDQPRNEPVGVAAAMPEPLSETSPAPAKDSKLRERGRRLPVEKPSWMGRLLQSTPFKIAAVVVLAALALYAARDRFWSIHKPASMAPETPISAPPSPAVQIAVEPPVAAESQTGTELAREAATSASEVSAKKDSARRAESVDSGPAIRECSPAVSIQDDTGAGRGPVLRKMTPIPLSQGMLSSLTAKASCGSGGHR